MGFDLSRWITDEKLEDHTKKPIRILIEDFSDRYDLVVTIQAFKKGEK